MAKLDIFWVRQKKNEITSLFMAVKDLKASYKSGGVFTLHIWIRSTLGNCIPPVKFLPELQFPVCRAISSCYMLSQWWLQFLSWRKWPFLLYLFEELIGINTINSCLGKRNHLHIRQSSVQNLQHLSHLTVKFKNNNKSFLWMISII